MNQFLTLVCAVGSRGEFGLRGGLPWGSKGDLRWFKRLTDGHTLIVGHRTAETLPPLPGRRVLVLDSKNLEETLEEARRSDIEPMVIGGARTIMALEPWIRKAIVTIVHGEWDADVFFSPGALGLVPELIESLRGPSDDLPQLSRVTYVRA